MKGSLHTDEMIKAVLAQPALRTGRRMSHVFRFDVPLYPKPLLITDAALNIRPTLEEKVDIIQNAIDFARILGVETPKVAILSAVETVNPNIPSTIDAAALCKMADRGQIKGGLLDGPLAFDNAISAQAAEIKHIESRWRARRHPGRARPGERQHAGQAARIPGGRLRLGHRAGRARAHRPDQPRRRPPGRVASALLARLVAHHRSRTAASESSVG
jgi:phosphate acetyltransferase